MMGDIFSMRWVASLLGALMLCSCASEQIAYTPGVYAEPSQADLFDWQGYGLTGPVKIVINLSTQRADIYIGGQYAGWTAVATGKAGFGTPAGEYTIVEKVADKRSSIYGKIVDASGNTINHDADARRDRPPPGGQFIYAPMPNWMRLTWGGIGMHAGPIPQPGTPASHGCIRLPDEMAAALFDRVQIGTPVEIVR